MITAKGLLYFVIGFLLIGLLIIVSGFSAEAMCVSGVKDMTHGGGGYNLWIGSKVPSQAVSGQITYGYPISHYCPSGNYSYTCSYYTTYTGSGAGHVGIFLSPTWDCTGGSVYVAPTNPGTYYQFG